MIFAQEKTLTQTFQCNRFSKRQIQKADNLVDCSGLLSNARGIPQPVHSYNLGQHSFQTYGHHLLLLFIRFTLQHRTKIFLQMKSIDTFKIDVLIVKRLQKQLLTRTDKCVFLKMQCIPFIQLTAFHSDAMKGPGCQQQNTVRCWLITFSFHKIAYLAADKIIDFKNSMAMQRILIGCNIGK